MTSASVERITIAPDFSLSRIVTGLWQIADMERSGPVSIDATAAALLPYVEKGLTTFDMADHYGSAERIAGTLRITSGRPVELLTKWVPPAGPATRESVRAAVETSLRRMQSDRLDLLQFHAWNYADPGWLERLFWLQDLKDEGLIRHLGLTNFDTAHLRIVVQSGIGVVTNQVCFSLLDQRANAGMTAFCEQHNIKLLAFGTLAGGLLTERWLGKPEPEPDHLNTWSLMKYKRFIEVSGGWSGFQTLLRAVEDTGRRHGVSMANVASRFMLDQPAVGAVIIGARPGQSEHIADNMQLFKWTLDEEAESGIRAAMAALQPIPGDCGDEYRTPPYLTASGDLSHHLDSMPPPYASTRSGTRSRVETGTYWEKVGGFCRAVRCGNFISVSGTTATLGDRAIGGADAVAQTHFIIDKIDGALQSLGARLRDVIRTRIYVRDLVDWEIVARAHGERFRDILPANTLVRADLVGEDYLVEMEADAMLP